MTARLFSSIVWMEVKRRMSYRGDFWLGWLGTVLVGIGVPYFLWRAIFLAQGGAETRIGGYDLDAMVFYYIAAALISRVVGAASLPHELADDIFQGTLNRYLIYPAPYVLFRYASHVGAAMMNYVQFLFVGGVLLAIFPSLQDRVTGGGLLLCTGLLLLANVLWLLLSLPLQMMAFWYERVWSLVVMLRFASSLLGGALLPLSLFSPEARRWIDWMPFQLLFDVPVAALSGTLPLARALHIIVVAFLWIGLFLALSAWTWRRGIRTYTGIGI